MSDRGYSESDEMLSVLLAECPEDDAIGSLEGGASAGDRDDAVATFDLAEPVSVVEPRADDVPRLILNALIDDTLWALATRDVDAAHREPGGWRGRAVAPVGERETMSPPEQDVDTRALEALVDEDTTDQALWSLLRQNWRRGTSPFGDTVH